MSEQAALSWAQDERERDREAFRAATIARIPGWYRAWLHFAATTGIGLGLAAPALLLVRDYRWWHLAWAAAVVVLSNATEWRAHRDLLHRRTPGFTVLYDRHTPEHHRIFVTWDMAVRESREFARVLIPSYGIFSVFLVTLPISGGLIALGQWDPAMIFVATSMLYVVSYECLHAAYHAPAASWVGRRALVQRLRRHHAAHHDPRLMQKWNFNVTLPLWDWVRGTVAPAGAARFGGQ